MKIAIFSDNFYPELSGISDSVIALAEELTKRGHFVHFYAPKYSAAEYKIVNLPHKEINLGPNVEISRFSSFYFGSGSQQGRAVIPVGIRTIGISRFNPDVIHAQTFFGVGLEALAAAKILKKPLIGTNHTSMEDFLRYNPIKADWADNLILKYVNWYYGKCKIVTAPSRAVFDEMSKTGFKKEGMVISNPIDMEMFRPLHNKAELQKKFGLGDQTIIHAGRLAAERSIDVILKAMAIVRKKIPKAELALCGRGANEKDLRSLAASLGIADSVKFLGFVTRQELVEAYNASKIFAITSTSDTQSLVTMQAMACKLPVIGVNARGLPEYINSRNGILIDPGDEKALAEKIIFLLTHDDKRKKLAIGARNFAEKFSTPAITTSWEKIYEMAIKKYNTKAL